MLNLEYAFADVKKFDDGQISLDLSVKFFNCGALVISSFGLCPNDHLIEFLTLIHYLRVRGIKNITALMPYFPYARQDDDTGQRNLTLALLKAAGVDKIFILDIHSIKPDDIKRGLYNILPFKIFQPVLKHFALDRLLFISPDRGGGVRTRAFAQEVGAPFIILNKHKMPNKSCLVSSSDYTEHNISNFDCIIVDDLLDSGATLIAGVEFLVQNKAKSINAFITHGLFSARASEFLQKSSLQNVYVTDSLLKNDFPDLIKVLPSSKALACALHNLVDVKRV